MVLRVVSSTVYSKIAMLNKNIIYIYNIRGTEIKSLT